YDERCSQRIRRAFRPPPMFLGASQDFSFATAYVSQTVTEAQVFTPEREEFDKAITMQLLPELGYPDHKIVSEPLIIEDTNHKMAAIKMFFNDPRVSDQDVVDAVNDAAGTHFKLVPEDQRSSTNALTVDDRGDVVPSNGDDADDDSKPGDNEPDTRNATPATQPQPRRGRLDKSERINVLDLAQATMSAITKRDFPALESRMSVVCKLDPAGMTAFRKACATISFADPQHDPEGLADLAEAARGVIMREHGPEHGQTAGCC
ncbi:MAG: hypothetical protein LC676_16715, partial [Loktanella sp.]|nr:hypothetical protein [Loktanella sp.]